MLRGRSRALVIGGGLVAALSACNLLLGIDDLPEETKGPSDGGGDSTQPGDGTTSDVADARTTPPCTGGATDPDPCSVEILPADGGGNVYPTFKVVSDLTINVGDPDDGGGIESQNNRNLVPDDAGPGRIYETVTKLAWTTALAADAGLVDLDGARQACAALPGGWRVPTRVEAATLQYRPFVPTLDGGAPTQCVTNDFSPPAQYGIWTSTTTPSGAAAYGMLESACGFVRAEQEQPVLGVRCVRAVSSAATFEVRRTASPPFVWAKDTALDWERGAKIVSLYSEALAHCSSLGPTWRLPIAQELYGILDTSGKGGVFFDARLFVAPAGTPTAILSQTVLAAYPDDAGAEELQYETVSVRAQDPGEQNGILARTPKPDTLVRCVRKHQ